MAPLVGYNDNIEHRGQVYHVQTEDSGPRRPHVITHLFADGGRIVTSTKTSYQDHVDAEDADEKVRALMRAQHKAMLAALQSGEFDDVLEEQAQALPAAPRPSPPVEPRGAGAGQVDEFAPPGAVVAGAAAGGVPPVRDAAASSMTEGTPPAGTPAAVPAPADSSTRQPTPLSTEGESSAPELVIEADEPAVASAAPLPLVDLADDSPGEETKPGRKKPTTEPEVVPPVGSSVPVDVLERAAAEADRDFHQGIRPEVERSGGHRPRKPTPLHGAGTYRYVAPEAADAQTPLSSDAFPPPRKRRFPQTNPGRRKASDGDSADAPGAEGVPPGDGDRPFGERFLTNRSLDVVILDFLARHLDR